MYFNEFQCIIMLEFVVGESLSLLCLQLNHENPWWPRSHGGYCISDAISTALRYNLQL